MPGCGGNVASVPASGSPVRWRYGAGGDVAIPLAVRDEALYAAAAPGLVALDPVTGDELWVALPGSRPHWVEPTAESIFVAMNEQVAAVDGDTGQERWRAEVGGLPAGVPALGTSIVTIGTMAGDIVGFDLASGTERWRYTLGAWVASGPTVVTDVVYAGYAGYAGDEPGTVVALGATDGRERWRATLGDDLAATPTIAHETVFVVGRNGIYALDSATGEERWRIETWFNRYAYPTTPVVVDDTVYVGAGDGALYALDAATGAEQWVSSAPELSGYVGSEPLIVGDVFVFVTQLGGSVAAVDAATGQLHWSYPLSGTEFWPAVVPAPASDSVYTTIGSDLAALDPVTGEERWCLTLDSFADQLLADDEAVYIGTGNTGMIAVATDAVPGTPAATPDAARSSDAGVRSGDGQAPSETTSSWTTTSKPPTSGSVVRRGRTFAIWSR
ncbi:MAG: PQQ-binding-like beta-propeller repeat protein [Chloroflexota bacterium]|nr:PQQ-binding-like beta-propeller repeat protein [Chloroflexota bacterium]